MNAPTNPLQARPTVNTSKLSRIAAFSQLLALVVAGMFLTNGFGGLLRLPNWWTTSQRPDLLANDSDLSSAYTRDGSPVSPKERLEAKQENHVAVQKAEHTLRIIRQCFTELEAWEKQTKDLLTNDSGKIIASSTKLVREFQAAIYFPHPPREDVQSMSEAVQGLLNDWKNSESSPLYVPPSQKMLDILNEHAATAVKIHSDYHRANREVKALVELAHRELKPGKTTLKEELAEMRTQQFRESLAVKQKKYDESRLELARIEAEHDDKRLAAQVAWQKQAMEDERKNDQIRAEKERLVKLAHSDYVKYYLGALFQSGRDQPLQEYTREKIAEFRTEITRPVSFSMIIYADWLSDSPKAYFNIANFSARQGLSKDRPALPIAGDINAIFQQKADQKTIEILKKIQSLLRELGPTLVEEKLLAP